MPPHVGERFLHDPVDGQIEPGGKLMRLPLDRERSRRGRPPGLLDQRGQGPRCRAAAAISSRRDRLGSRTMATSRRISLRASAPCCGSSPARRAHTSGSSSTTCSAAPACTTITLTACATMSCNSRAMLARSSAIAIRVRFALPSRSRSLAACASAARRSAPRTIHPDHPRHRDDYPVEDDSRRAPAVRPPAGRRTAGRPTARQRRRSRRDRAA